MAKQEIIPVRVSRADRASLRAAAGGRPVSTWLRELGLEEARRRSSARTVARLIEEARASGPGSMNGRPTSWPTRRTREPEAGRSDDSGGRRHNVVISGLLSPSGRPARILQAAGISFRLVWSPGIVAECLRVLDYPRVARVLHAARREEQAREVLRALAAGADIVAQEMLPRLAVVKADPDDDQLLATALGGGASVVVSGDRRHLLPLGEFAGVRILDPAAFLVEIDPLASRAREPVAAYAPARAPAAPVLHDPGSGRIDGRRLATYLDVPLAALARAAGKNYKAVFRSPASAPLQPRLAPIHRTVVALERVLGDRAPALAWLNGPNGAFGGRTPLSLVMSGEAEAVARLVEETVARRRPVPGCAAG